MHTKLINPATDGHKVYHNLGTSDRLIAYLLHEAREQKAAEEIFFDQYREGIGPETVRLSLNNHVKGLRKNEEKFFTLVLSPGEEELRHIGNDDRMLKGFVRQVMEDYARHFKLKDGRQLKGEDLLWFAVIHADRRLKQPDLAREAGGLSEKEQRLIRELRDKGDPLSLKAVEKIERMALRRNAEKADAAVALAGERKAGLHKHVHIVVSRRDKRMQYSLHPRGWKARFDLRKWQESNGMRFREMFGYSGETISEGFYFPRQGKAYFDRKVEETIHFINEHCLGEEKLDAGAFQRLGAKYNYSRAFFINMGKLKSRFRLGDFFVDPYHFVARGRDIKPEEYVHQDKREEKKDWHPRMERKTMGSPAFSRAGRFQELLAALGQYRAASHIRDPMLFEHERKRRRKLGMREQEEGKGQEHEPDH